MLSEIQLQRQTLRLYGELMARWEQPGGKLVFAMGPQAVSSGLAAAASIAGATALIVDPDLAAAKAVFRRGGIDFLVNTLDEALRVLKNEVRKRRPLSVALQAPPPDVLQEMVVRGVLPDMQLEDASQGRPTEVAPGLAALESKGMETLELQRQEEIFACSGVLRGWLAERQWREVAVPAAAASRLSFGDGIREVWMRRLGQYQRLSAGGDRMMWLTEAEQAELTAP